MKSILDFFSAFLSGFFALDIVVYLFVSLCFVAVVRLAFHFVSGR